MGAVQTAQDFYNLDSFQHRMNWRTRVGWQQQELFFNVIQPGKDRFNAAFYCGSPAMLRRSALEEMGGFATETITEDMHTGMRLQKKKRPSSITIARLAFGLAPQTFVGFATQWQRWGHGCMQVLRARKSDFRPRIEFRPAPLLFRLHVLLLDELSEAALHADADRVPCDGHLPPGHDAGGCSLASSSRTSS